MEREYINLFICEGCMHWFYPNYPLSHCNICEDKPLLKKIYCYAFVKLSGKESEVNISNLR